VATGERRCGCASSPTSFKPSDVTSVIRSRRAGSTVLALISVIGFSPMRLLARPWPSWPSLPARAVPVPPLLQTRRVARPHHNVRGARCEFLVAAGAAICLRRGGAGDLTNDPVAIGPLFQLRRPEPDGVGPTGRCGFWSGTARPPGLARRVGRQPARLPWAHVYFPAGLQPPLLARTTGPLRSPAHGIPAAACSPSSTGGANVGKP